MEVRCIQCGAMFSVDDNEYQGEWENFCGQPCQVKWFHRRNDGTPVTEEPEPFVWKLETEEKDGV